MRDDGQAQEDPRDLWVFGYGSLMWRPGFAFLERVNAHLFGYHRALCVRSHVHRGTPERPGVVLGLDRGGRCHGVAFRVAGAQAEATIAYLREREQVTSVYRERRLPVRIKDRGTVEALAYVVDRRHEQYLRLDRFEEILALVGQGVGMSGANTDYVLNTRDHLVAMGVRDPLLERLAGALADRQAAQQASVTS